MITNRLLFLLQNGAFLGGPDFTMADVYFFSIIGFRVRLGLSLEKFSKLKADYERARASPRIQATWPPHWKATSSSMSPLKGRI